MQRWMLSFLVVLFSATLAAAQQMPPQPVTAPPGELVVISMSCSLYAAALVRL